MNRKLLSLAVAAVLVAPFAARAQSADPTPEEIRKVNEYFQNGKDKGPILAEVKACMAIDTKKDSPTIWDCSEEATGKVKKNAVVNAWMNWLVPKDGKYDDVMIQYLHEGTVRTTLDLTLSTPSTRARLYKAATANKSGKWEIKVLRGGKELGSAKFEVE